MWLTPWLLYQSPGMSTAHCSGVLHAFVFLNWQCTKLDLPHHPHKIPASSSSSPVQNWTKRPQKTRMSSTGERTAPALQTRQPSTCLCMYSHAHTHTYTHIHIHIHQSLQLPSSKSLLEMLLELCQCCSWAPLHFSLWYSNILTSKWSNSTTSITMLLTAHFWEKLLKYA